MARIRSVKPELRTSQLVASWPIEVRYFWVLLWGYLDDKGRGVDSTKAIAGDCFPWDDKIMPATIDRWLRLMTTKVDGEPGPVCRYTVAGKPYLHAVNWSEHQRPNRPSASRLPPCPIHESLTEEFTAPLTARLTELVSEGLNGRAAEQQSRGAEEQQHAARESGGEPPPAVAAAAKIIINALDHDGCSFDEALIIAERIRFERRPRNLPGLVRAIAQADGELEQLLVEHRAARSHIDVQDQLDAARAGPDCEHGEPGGEAPHPTTGEPLCALCRAAYRAAITKGTP